MEDRETLLQAMATYNVFQQLGGIPKELLRDNPDNLSLLARHVIEQNLPEVMACLSWEKTNTPKARRMVYAQDCARATALHHATRSASSDFCHVLLDHGADVNAEDKDGDTPLHWACMQNAPVPMLQLLIKRGANTRITNTWGKTAADLATSIQHKAFFSTLSSQ